MNVYINTNVRDAFAALSDLLNRKEYAEKQLSVASRWNPLYRLELQTTIKTLEKEISAMQSTLATTPSYAW
jgi:hypothetical protein